MYNPVSLRRELLYVALAMLALWGLCKLANLSYWILALAAAGYLLAVATGKGRRGLDRALESTGLGSYFHATRCADETFSKPHPEMLHQIMDELGTRPGETLMIGDTEYDMLMASNAGTAALGVSYGVHEPERLLQHQARDTQCLAALVIEQGIDVRDEFLHPRIQLEVLAQTGNQSARERLSFRGLLHLVQAD